MLFGAIDLGGTNIKAAVVDEKGQILAEGSVPTGLPRPARELCRAIADTLLDVLAGSPYQKKDLAAVGIGSPGMVDDVAGVVVYDNNLDWANVPAADWLREDTGLPVAVGNDANVAALGEALYGCAKGAHSAVILTLGTGVGGGVVLGGRLWTGFNGAASELGHMVINPAGELCTCGQRGCLETYASATALLRLTRRAMEQTPDSAMHALAAEQGFGGQLAFAAAAAGDAAGRQVVDTYIQGLAIGVADIINILFPEVIGFSGGVAKQGEVLLEPLRREVAARVYGHKYAPRQTRLVSCTLGYRAGLVGAAALAAQKVTRLG